MELHSRMNDILYSASIPSNTRFNSIMKQSNASILYSCCNSIFICPLHLMYLHSNISWLCVDKGEFVYFVPQRCSEVSNFVVSIIVELTMLQSLFWQKHYIEIICISPLMKHLLICLYISNSTHIKVSSMILLHLGMPVITERIWKKLKNTVEDIINSS